MQLQTYVDSERQPHLTLSPAGSFLWFGFLQERHHLRPSGFVELNDASFADLRIAQDRTVKDQGTEAVIVVSL